MGLNNPNLNLRIFFSNKRISQSPKLFPFCWFVGNVSAGIIKLPILGGIKLHANVSSIFRHFPLPSSCMKFRVGTSSSWTPCFAVIQRWFIVCVVFARTHVRGQRVGLRLLRLWPHGKLGHWTNKTTGRGRCFQRSLMPQMDVSDPKSKI